MNRLNKYLPFIIGAATMTTVLFFSYVRWQSQRFERIEKELENEIVMQKLRAHALDSQIDRLTTDPSPESSTPVKNTTQLYQFLTRIASENQMLIVRVNLNPVKTKTETAAPPMEVVLAGNYQNAMDFLTSLRQLETLKILKMDLAVHNEDPTQSLQLRLLFNLAIRSEVSP